MTAQAKKSRPKGPSPREAPSTATRTSRIQRTSELSEQLVTHIAGGQREAIEAVRKFMKSADRAIPSSGPGPTRPHVVIDSALEMSERLVKAERDFARNVVHSVGETLGAADGRT